MEYWFITWPDRSLTVAARIEAHSEPRPLGSAPWPFGPPKPMKTDLLCGAGFQPADRISSGPPAEGRRMRLQRSGSPALARSGTTIKILMFWRVCFALPICQAILFAELTNSVTVNASQLAGQPDSVVFSVAVT